MNGRNQNTEKIKDYYLVQNCHLRLALDTATHKNKEKDLKIIELEHMLRNKIIATAKKGT